ncbi:MAG: response regulator, partial [Verrucomicrobia bacterium]|nr:response regulator [Verrucomicrobiota bacterium]
VELMTSHVAIIDDEPSVCKSFERVLKTKGYRTETFGSSLAFLESDKKPNCLLLDINLPGMSGLDLQNELLKGDFDTPIVFITGNGNIPKSVRAIKAGAVDFLYCVEEIDLFNAVEKAIEKDTTARKSGKDKLELSHKIYSLTPREYEVLTYVITGIPNKAIAVELRASEKTIKVHRGRLMQKMGASSIVDLVKLADKGGIQPATISG